MVDSSAPGASIGVGVRLRSKERARWRELLADVNLTRTSVCAAMEFALSHTEAADDVARLLREAAAARQASPVALAALLYLANDLLYNSAAPVPGAARYRAALAAVLPDVFETAARCRFTVCGRMSAAALSERVDRVLAAWERMSIFAPVFLWGLRCTFAGRSGTSYVPSPSASAACSTTPVAGGTAAAAADDGASAVHAVADDAAPSAELTHLRRRCSQAGLPSTGSVAVCTQRLMALGAFTKERVGVDLVAMDAAVHSGASASAAAPVPAFIPADATKRRAGTATHRLRAAHDADGPVSCPLQCGALQAALASSEGVDVSYIPLPLLQRMADALQAMMATARTSRASQAGTASAVPSSFVLVPRPPSVAEESAQGEDAQGQRAASPTSGWQRVATPAS
ncbi:hypothetical protein EON68_03255 [archaeon]|nr:MAG: hypothetical protein EON68_03255 [archaeon]